MRYDATLVRVTTPENVVPSFYRQRLRWAELMMDDHRAATLRWTHRNATQPRRCECGAPGTVRVGERVSGVAGSVAPYWWRCDEHADVPLTVPWAGGVPLINQRREDCSWRSSNINALVVTDCGCGTHVGELAS